MISLDSFNSISKGGSQNCKLKSNLANFPIWGIVFDQQPGHGLMKRVDTRMKNVSSHPDTRVVKFPSREKYAVSRIRGLSMQHAN